MADAKQRSFRDLVDSAHMELMPGPLTADEAEKLAESRTPLTVHEITTHDTKDYGQYWDFIIELRTGERRMVGWPEGPRRDPNMTVLAQLVQDGPVSGVIIQNLSKPGKQPYYILAPF